MGNVDNNIEDEDINIEDEDNNIVVVDKNVEDMDKNVESVDKNVESVDNNMEAEETEDPGTEVLAWESLEVARKICEKFLKISYLFYKLLL